MCAGLRRARSRANFRQTINQVLYRLEPSGPGVYRAVNQAQPLSLDFTVRGTRLEHPEGSATLHLLGYGYGEHLRTPGQVQPVISHDRVEYRRTDLTEWYQNEATGLEQGFTVSQFQRELKWGFLADASYVGNITQRLPVSLNLNSIPANVLNGLPVADRPAYFNAQVPNPLAGLLPSSGINGATVPRQQLFYEYLQFTQVTITDVPNRRAEVSLGANEAGPAIHPRYWRAGLVHLPKNLERVSVLNNQDVVQSNLLATPLEQRLTQFDTPQKFSLIVTAAVPLAAANIGAAMCTRWSTAFWAAGISTLNTTPNGISVRFSERRAVGGEKREPFR